LSATVTPFCNGNLFKWAGQPTTHQGSIHEGWREMDYRITNSKNSLLEILTAMSERVILRIARKAMIVMAATSCLIFSQSAQSATVYSQPGTPVSSASIISSNAVANPDGSDGDVTAYDNFTLGKAAIVKGVKWRGSSSSAGLAGFTVNIFASTHDPAAQPDTSAPLGRITVDGKANEKIVGNGLSEYSADFDRPLALTAGVQYWISIVSTRNDLSPWGWANGTGGDGKSIQSYSELRILPAPGDRSFSLIDAR
jgi:hypothetical protein